MLPQGVISPQEEYRQRMKHDFSRYIYLGLKSGKWQQASILKEIYNRPGYLAYKIICHNLMWSHIYIKFEDKRKAKEAILYFENLSSDLTAEIEDNLLCSWYCYEAISDLPPSYTFAIADTEGKPPLLIANPEPFFATKLNEFGQPQVIYSRQLKDRSVALVLFSSMAEALGAAIAHGEWHTRYGKTENHFYYRVKIIGRDKEASLIKTITNSDSGAVEAFKLDYFVNADDKEWGSKLIAKISDYANTASPENQTCIPVTENFDGYQMNNGCMREYCGNSFIMDSGINMGYGNVGNIQLNHSFLNQGHGNRSFCVYNTHLQGDGHISGSYENGFTNVYRRGNRRQPRGSQRGRYQKRISPRVDQRIIVSNTVPTKTYGFSGWITENTLNAAEFYPRGNYCNGDCEVSELTTPQFNVTDVENIQSPNPVEPTKRNSLSSNKELPVIERCEPVAPTQTVDLVKPSIEANKIPPPVPATKGRQYQRGNKRNKRR